MTNNSIKYPIGIQSFSKIRENGYAYVDKTAWMYKLVEKGSSYFLSRPRRFGKSLLLSTLQAYFEGRKDLFKGLAIESMEKKWDSFPVILLSFATYRPSDQNIEALLDNRWSELESRFGKLTDTVDPAERFRNIIRAAHDSTGKKVVILVDEYDAPLVAHLTDKEIIRERVRDLLKSVYVNLKDLDQYLQFVMLTGISRFSKLTIFSGLNNLKDISMIPAWNDICGITENELIENFGQGIEALGENLHTDYNGALKLLKENYDGYHFTEDSADIYNPFSLLNALSDSAIDSYWFRSATPTFLVKYLNASNGSLSKIMTETVSARSLADIETYRTSPAALLFQTGYLTIKEYDSRRRRYTLGIPNKEVETGLYSELLSYNLRIDQDKMDGDIWEIKDLLEAGKPDEALKHIRSFFAGVPGNTTAKHPEIFYENNLFLLFKLIGIDARAEWWTSDGRIDILLEMTNCIYIMELKLDKSAEDAIDQINSKDYALPWKYDGRRVFKIGINFLTSTRNIDKWIIEF